MTRGVRVRLLTLPALTGRVVGANYARRRVRVDFGPRHGVVWLRASDVTHMYPVVCAVPVSRAGYAK